MTQNSRFPAGWTAPEVGETRQVTKKADVWSFGITLWEIAEQETPKLNQDRYRPQKTKVTDSMWEMMQRCWLPENQRPTFDQICVKLGLPSNAPVYI